MARIAWHPAFVQAMAIELVDYRDVLTFEPEHQLTAEPLKIQTSPPHLGGGLGWGLKR